MDLPETNNPFSNGRIVSIDTDREVYHRTLGGERGKPDHIMSSHELRDFWTNPRRWLKGWHSEETDAKDWGTLVETLLLQPKSFSDGWAVKPETYPAPKDHAKVKKGEIAAGDPLPWNANAGECKAWEAAHEGKELVKFNTMKSAELATAELREDPDCGPYLQCSAPQVFLMAEYRDKETGLVVPVKGMLDLLPDRQDKLFGKSIGDLKCVQGASLGAWNYAIKSYRHHWQAALYLWLSQTLPNELGERLEFRHILSETCPPYEVTGYQMSLEFLELGKGKVLDALKFYAACLKANHWPGYAAKCRDTFNGFGIVDPPMNLIQYED